MTQVTIEPRTDGKMKLIDMTPGTVFSHNGCAFIKMSVEYPTGHGSRTEDMRILCKRLNEPGNWSALPDLQVQTLEIVSIRLRETTGWKPS